MKDDTSTTLARRARVFLSENAPRLPVALRRVLHTVKGRIFYRFYDDAFELVEEGSFVVRAPGFMGSFEIGFRSDILRTLLKDKAYEPELVELVREHVDPEKDVLDVGANVGFFTVLCARLIADGRRVLAVEPTPRAVDYLRRNIERNDAAESVIVFEGIATDAPGTYPLHVIPGMEEYSSLGALSHPATQGHEHRVIDVRGDTVDSLVEASGLAPGFMKIDTEGAEFLVLSGALQTLRTHRPVILSELSDNLLANFGHSSAEVLDLLLTCGYEVVDAENPGIPVRAPFSGEILARPV